MHLASVEIKNFRCFEYLKCDFQPGLNVLVGRNNTGKTNLLHAIRLAVGSNSSQSEPFWLDRDDFYRASADEESDPTIEVTLEFADLSPHQRSFFYEIVEFDLANTANSTAIIRFEAAWPRSKRHPSIRRLAGNSKAETVEVPSSILQSLPITFLPALRDAEAALAPGYRSKLAAVLQSAARRNANPSIANDISEIYATANLALEAHPLVSAAVATLQTTTSDLAGSDYSRSVIRAASVEFEKILRSLQVQMDGLPFGELRSNGLGYNNLLYVAVVLQHLAAADVDECPLFLVEEPEAHLHPQLTLLLADYLAHKKPGSATPQTIVTTHSPTIAAHVPPDRLAVLFSSGGRRFCHGLAQGGFSKAELSDLARMMDVTRAALYFSKGVILVEGISEALLLPVLAKLEGYDLSKLHISVIPICGVAFQTFKKLLDPGVLEIPVAIVTDGDPPITRGSNWRQDSPNMIGEEFTCSANTSALCKVFHEHPTVRVFHSNVTLEFDLADAGDTNADVMASIWEECFESMPRTFNRELVEQTHSKREKALAAWRGICRAEHSGSKGRFAQRLAQFLVESSQAGDVTFKVPPYVRAAIAYVASHVEGRPEVPTPELAS